MRALLILLLTGILLVQPGGSLWCYTCRIQFKSDNCKKAVFCKEKTKSCKTDMISLLGFVNIISKDCASSCTTYNKDISIAKRNISCCSTDLCNNDDTSATPAIQAQMATVAFTSIACMILSRML